MPRSDARAARRRSTYQGERVDLGPPFAALTMSEAVREQQSRARARRTSAIARVARERLRAAAASTCSANDGAGQAAARAVRGDGRGDAACSRPSSSHYPAEVSPLARAQRRRSGRHRPLRALHRADASSPTASPSSTIPRTRRRASARRSRRKDAGRRGGDVSTTPTTSARSSTACRRPAGSASASTGW